eukprot:4434396-Prymnesium_polylepis.1
MIPREPMTAPCATERSRLHMLLIAEKLFVPLSTRSEIRAPSSRSDQVGPLPFLFTFYSSRPVRAPRRQKAVLLSKTPACDGGTDALSHHNYEIRIQCDATEPGKSQNRPGELLKCPISIRHSCER